MNNKESQQNTVSDALNTFLAGTRLSMDQVAKKWNVSTAMLSQIKNGKKRAGVDLGLKILRESGRDIDTRRGWLEQRYLDESREFSLVQDEIKKNKVEKKLQNEFCEMLENNPILMDIFLDIALSEDAGVSWNSVLKNYGEHGIDLADSLIESSIIIFKESRFHINQENVTFITDEESSFGIVKAIIEMQRTRKKRGLFKGELQYDVTDINREAYEELIELNKEYVKKVRKILEENEMHRLIGGIRVVCQSLVSIAKGSLCLIIALGMLSSAMAGGLRGGSSNKALMGGISGGSSNTRPRDYRGKFGKEFTFRQITFNVPTYFDDKQDAVQTTVLINKQFEAGDIPEEFVKKFVVPRSRNCLGKGNRIYPEIRREIKDGKVKAVGFNLKESFNADGEVRFKVSASYYFPCEKKSRHR